MIATAGCACGVQTKEKCNPLQIENEARVSCVVVRMLGQDFYWVCYSVTVGASSHLCAQQDSEPIKNQPLPV